MKSRQKAAPDAYPEVLRVVRLAPIILAVCVSMLTGVMTLCWAGLKVDEDLHLRQAELFAGGRMRLLRCSDVTRIRILREAADRGERLTAAELRRHVADAIARDGGVDEPILSMVPGYHAALAVAIRASQALGAWLGCRTPSGVVASVTSWLISLGLLVYLCRLRGSHGANDWRDLSSRGTLAVAIAWSNALLLPFHWLIYTDVLAALFVVAIVVAELEHRPVTAGLLGIPAMLVRQSNIAVVAASPFIDLSRRLPTGSWAGGERLKRELRLWVAAHWANGLSISLFVLFVAWNGRVSIGPREAHTAALTTSAIAFCLATFAVCCLPLILWTVWVCLVDVTRRPPARVVAAIVMCAVIGATVFRASHHWNSLEECPWLIRNHFVLWLQTSHWGWIPVGRLLLCLLLGTAGVTLAATPLVPGCGLFVLISWILIVAPFQLIEPRYSLAPIVLWLGMRRTTVAVVEWLQFAWGLCWGFGIAFTHATSGMFI